MKDMWITKRIKPMCTDLVFSLCFCWVLLISMVDHYLTIKFQDTILGDEKNPIGLFLIHLDGGSVALFMTLKMIFLWLIYFILVKLYMINRVYSITALLVLSLIQLILFMYFVGFWNY